MLYKLNQESRRLGFKTSSCGPWNDAGKSEYEGYCKHCGRYDVELKNDCCRDKACRQSRFKTIFKHNENGAVTTIRAEI